MKKLGDLSEYQGKCLRVSVDTNTTVSDSLASKIGSSVAKYLSSSTWDGKVVGSDPSSNLHPFPSSEVVEQSSVS